MTITTITPNVNDVLLGKGTIINNHPGNQQFRSLVNLYKDTFVASKNKVKRSIAAQIYDDVRKLKPPGRFLVDDRVRGDETRSDGSYYDNYASSSDVHPNLLKKNWQIVEREKALEKIMHRLREKVGMDMATTPPVQLSVHEGDIDDRYRSGDASSGRLSYHSAMNSPDGTGVQVQDTAGDLPTEQGFNMPNNSIASSHSPNSTYTLSNSSGDPQFNGNTIAGYSTATEGLSISDTDLCKYLEEGGFDFESDRHVRTPTPQLDHDPSRQTHAHTLQQWIETSSPDINPSIVATSHLSSAMGNFIKSALLIALKLINCIMEFETDELGGSGNPIPLASIAPEYVMLGTKNGQHAAGGSDEMQEVIEHVWIMSIDGDDSATGTVSERLFALGRVLYYLFSMGVPMVNGHAPATLKTSLSSINLSSEAERDDNQAQKKHYWREVQADDTIFNYLDKLESNGVPWSLCALIRNLFECRLGSICEDDAYASFADLHLDLQLMVYNPACFLDNIQMVPMPKLTIGDEVYGRDDELLKLSELHMRHSTENSFIGTIISGEAGAGKSKLAMYIQLLTDQSNGYFLSAKFEHNQMSLKPMSTLAHMFDSLCEMLFNDSSQSQLKMIEDELTSALGSQTNLLGVVPNLKKLMPSLGRHETTASLCVDSAVSMRYLLSELLLVISSHSKPITIVIDDVQFADPASLLLIGDLLFSAQGAPIFIVLCHRDDEASISGLFKAWLTSITMFPLEKIKLESITPEAVSDLISEALHLSPRLTRPLSSVLHHKTRGNPLFLKQLLDSLTEQGFIYFDLNRHRWEWDLNTIMELEISDDVLAILMNDVQRLPSNLQFGLQVASCIGSCVTNTMLGYLSTELELDLKDILRQVSQKGFMIDIAGSTMFRFAHDKIQEAVYEMMTEQQRRENHMRLGLALCIQTLDNSVGHEELFFAAVNQINQGGPTAVHEPSQKNVIAQLNLKAGRRSIDLSDYNSAFTLFMHGISFLGVDHWLSSYELSLDLYNELAEVALILNNLSAVTFYSSEVVSHAKCFDDKLQCLITAAEVIGIQRNRPVESIENSFAVLAQCGDDAPRSIGDESLRTDIERMNCVLQSMPDDMICSMQKNNDANMNTRVSLYANLAYKLQYFQPWLLGSVSLRMVELTVKTGLSAKSPLAFAHFGGVLVTAGRINDGCRLGRLALKLVERKGSLQFKSRVIFFVFHHIFWASEPLQSIVEAHSLGHKFGQQSGDFKCAFHNLLYSSCTDYFAGQSLDVVEKNLLDFLSKLRSHGVKIFFKGPVLFLSQIMVLKEGPYAPVVSHAYNIEPSEKEILAGERPGSFFAMYGKLHHLARAFLFRQMDDAALNIDFSGAVAESCHQLNPHYLMGYFFEGLASFQLARQAGPNELAKWIERGQSVLAMMQCWSEHSSWNWESKALLLEAENMFTNGEFGKARAFYDSAIRSAREHKFIHEEAIASELVGIFYYERGIRQKSYTCLVHSVECYDKWGAHAVARRVETDIRDYFGTDIDQVVPSAGADSSLEYIFASSQGSKKKRQQGEGDCT